MTATTHIVFGTFSYLAVSSIIGIDSSLMLSSILVLVFASLLPDIDTPKSKLGKLLFFISHKVEVRFGHRTITHSFLFLVLSSILFYLIFFLFKNSYLILPFVIGVFSHIFLDTLNKQGVLLFYPSQIWCILPKNRNYRVEVGSNAEWIFLGILIILTVLIYPISQKGLIKTLHYFMADIQSAVSDFQDYSLTNEVIADITAANNLTNKKDTQYLQSHRSNREKYIDNTR